MKIEFDNNAILAKMLKSEGIQKQAYALVADKVAEEKRVLIDSFLDSDVTKEIQAGPDVAPSKILPYGYGNLFSFLGFEEGSDPIAPVVDELNKISVTQKPIVTSRTWQFKIRVPSEDDIEHASPMHWETGRSWIDAITRGLSGFSHYLHSLTKRRGRSSGGIQTEEPIRPGGEYFGGTSYLIGMLGKFKRKLTS